MLILCQIWNQVFDLFLLQLKGEVRGPENELIFAEISVKDSRDYYVFCVALTVREVFPQGDKELFSDLGLYRRWRRRNV